jgi:hypothetical protein
MAVRASDVRFRGWSGHGARRCPTSAFDPKRKSGAKVRCHRDCSGIHVLLRTKNCSNNLSSGDFSQAKNGIDATNMLGRGQGLHFLPTRGSHVDDMRRESNVEVKMAGCCASRSWDYGIVGIRTDCDEWSDAIGIADSQDCRFGGYDVPAL